MKTYFIYILASQARGTLYIGVSNSLERRYFEHMSGVSEKSFTNRYAVKRLVYFEEAHDVETAIAREKQLKNWRRQWKINLIESMNPEWQDLSKLYRMDAETSSA